MLRFPVRPLLYRAPSASLGAYCSCSGPTLPDQGLILNPNLVIVLYSYT